MTWNKREVLNRTISGRNIYLGLQEIFFLSPQAAFREAIRKQVFFFSLLLFLIAKHLGLIFSTTDSRPQPVCFDIPLPNYGKACVKFTKNTIEKDHIRWCAALEFKSKHNGRDIPLGCFFFRGGEGHGVEMGTFLDPVSFISLLEDVFQASKVVITSHVIRLTYH